ncbi:DUF3593 domain containing protein [Nitzschia inconspicua]|uniref:DUF3593 domain containing protein n=1 Tax=Nitzschia inconspicua TaxID=303405 RepID=A0A9K3PX66_9STRA|nr:DUF3593 domain containing protein [Nitzschia inconspicua]
MSFTKAVTFGLLLLSGPFLKSVPFLHQSAVSLLLLPLADAFSSSNEGLFHLKWPTRSDSTSRSMEFAKYNKYNARSSHANEARSSKSTTTLFRRNNRQNRRRRLYDISTTSLAMTNGAMDVPTTIHTMSTSLDTVATSIATMNLDMGRDQAEALAGPFFGISLFPYLAFLWLLARPENVCPKGVTVGFATCLLFVFLTIPAAIASQLLYGVSLADCDWLHGSAESLLTITNLVTVVAFRQALAAKEQQLQSDIVIPMPYSATSWKPMLWLVIGLTIVATATAIVPAISDPLVHTPYLNGFMDLPPELSFWGAPSEPENALTVATWIIHISSLVEFLVAMGFCWRWADVVSNPTWKGLTWGLLPLHSSGITACTYHLFFNRIPILVPLQALLTCVGNTTAAIAAYRIARSNGWKPSRVDEGWISLADSLTNTPNETTTSQRTESSNSKEQEAGEINAFMEEEAETLVGFEDLGQALAGDSDYSFLLKLFAGCAAGSYIIKYGELAFDFPFDANVYAGLAFIVIPSSLNAYKWYRRGKDPSFEGWF